MAHQPRIEVPVKFNNAEVGKATVYADGSIIMEFEPIGPSAIGQDIFDLMHRGHIGYCSFAFELGDPNLWRKE